MRNLLHSPKAMELIICINGNNHLYLTKLVKQSNITYSHVCRILTDLKIQGLVKEDNNKKDSRIKRFHLTEKGKLVAKKWTELKNILN